MKVAFHCFCITGREHINVTVVGLPEHLVVLRFVTSAGVADFVGLDEFFTGQRVVIEDSHPAFVGVLCPLQFVFIVCTASAATRLGLDQRGVVAVFTYPLVGIAVFIFLHTTILA